MPLALSSSEEIVLKALGEVYPDKLHVHQLASTMGQALEQRELLRTLDRLYTRGVVECVPLRDSGGWLMRLSELLIGELKDLYSAEKQVTRALSKLAKAVKAPELKDAFLSHLEETKSQVARLEQIFVILGKRPTGKTCVGMKGILEESLEVLLQTGKGVIRDAALISTVRRVEHYEIAGYVSAQGLAKLLGIKILRLF